MERPTPQLTCIQIGTRWRVSAPSRFGPLTAHGNTLDEARTALEQILGIARAIELTRSGGRAHRPSTERNASR